ncbi:MAG: hypothetical protein LBT79_00265 [Elusimicrobiota bacterium]|jgi:hypothetical protein|nr:hypothetical protein [Elusimicrobiota bacterium]
MKKVKVILKVIKNIFKGIFDSVESGKMTGCCGGYIPEHKFKDKKRKKND